uniref:Uncharacterized protein n=1 Tax=Pristionchus pacificus TaxID=54126 RepID=A0A2A6CFK0_PRIPA|eukprot:PDM76994.1 hypothetical protein PRIPAC_42389 [Pristionchus pacificus]
MYVSPCYTVKECMRDNRSKIKDEEEQRERSVKIRKMKKNYDQRTNQRSMAAHLLGRRTGRGGTTLLSLRMHAIHHRSGRAEGGGNQ